MDSCADILRGVDPGPPGCGPQGSSELRAFPQILKLEFSQINCGAIRSRGAQVVSPGTPTPSRGRLRDVQD